MFGISSLSNVVSPLTVSLSPSNISSSENEDIIILENPDLVIEEKETDSPSLQKLIERLHQLARFPQSADAEQIAELLVPLNEFLQSEPCFFLEHYQVRILQLKKMLSDAERLPGGDQLCSVLKQHLFNAEQAASTLYRESANPAQDSLWQLYERILHLPTLEPDLFGAAVAILTEMLPHALAFDPLVKQLQALLPQLLPPAHYLWGQTEPYADAEQKLEDIKQKSLVLLHRLRSAPEGYVKIFCVPMKSIFETYKGFLDEFTRASKHKRAEMQLPKAQLNGVGLGFFLLGQEHARALLCRNSQGAVVKENSSYTHAVYHKTGVFYKSNSHENYACIRPEMEFAIHTFYQLLGQRGVAPTCLVKVSHLFLNEQSCPHGWTLQAGYGIEGILLKDLLAVANVLPFLNNCLGESLAKKAFEWLVEDNWQEEFFNDRPHLSPEALSSLDTEESARLLVNAFEALFANRPPRKKCLEFFDRASPERTIEQFCTYISKFSTGALVSSLALLTQYPDLAIISGARLRQVSCEELVELQLLIRKAKELFPGFSTEALLEELSQLMRRFDSADFSTHFIVTLLTNPFDHKADNLMVTLARNERGGIRSLSLVGIDNDQAFALGEDRVRSMLYLLDPMMKTSFDLSVAQRLLEMTPEGLIFNWLVALEEQNQSYMRWQKRGVYMQEDSFGIVEPPLHIPLEIDPRLIPSLYTKAKQLVRELAVSPQTHWDLLKKIQPKLARVYQRGLRDSDDPAKAYDEIARLFRDENFDNLLLEEELPPISLAVAAFQFLESLEISSLPIEQLVSLMGKAQRTFPNLIHRLALPGEPARASSRREFFLIAVKQGHHALVARLLEEERKSRIGVKEKLVSLIEVRNEERQTALLLACLRLDLEMIRLLMHYEADPQARDRDGRSAVTLCLTRFCDAPMKTAAVVRFLGDQPTAFLNANNKHLGGSSLHYLVEVAEKAPEEAEPLIAYLIKKGANPDLVDDKGRSPLDYAMERGQERLVKQLIYLGAGRILNVEIARIFFNSRPHLKESFAFLQGHSLLLRWHLALDTLRISHSLEGDVSLEGLELGKVTLPANITDELLDKQEDIRVSPQVIYGLRNVNKITLSNEHELFFKQYPQMPGVEYAIDTLFKLLIGHGTSFTDLARLTPLHGKSYPVLISQGIQGDNLHDVLKDPLKANRLEKLDPLHFSELLLASLLVNFEDAKPDNFILEPLPGGAYRLVGIDNDHAFVPPLVKVGGKTVQVKCILYCLDQMQKPLHPYARERFLSFKPELLLRHWLSELQKQNERYCGLFSESERRELFKPCKKHQGMVIPIVLKPSRQGKLGDLSEPGAIVDIYQKFRRLQIALQEAPALTGMEALRLVIPPLGTCYEEAFHTNNTPLQRFLSLTKTQYSTTTAGRSGTVLTSRQTLKSMGILEKYIWNESSEPGPALALQELENLQQEMQASDQQLSQIRDALQEGDVGPFNECQLDIHKEKVINGIPGVFDGIDFKAMSEEKQKRVLSAILTGNYRWLHLCGCAVLDSHTFNQLLHNSPQLLSLELRDCPKVDQEFLTELSQLSYLAKLCLNNLPQLRNISLPHPTLRQLEIIRCQGLQQLTISHTLKSLSIEDSRNLYSIEAKCYQKASRFRGPRLTKQVPGNFVLQMLHLKACHQLQPWCRMFESWLKESTGHEIQLQEVPLHPRQEHLGLVLKAVLRRSEAKGMLASLQNTNEASWARDLISCLIENCQTDQLLEKLNLGPYGRNATDAWLPIIALACPNLTSIDLSGCQQITDAGLGLLARVCPNLTSVSLEDCNQITDAGLQGLVKGCSSLDSVNLGRCNQITDAGVWELAKNCSKLTSLSLEDCNQITDTGLEVLANGCPNLSSVNLWACNHITDSGLRALAVGCRSLTFLNVGQNGWTAELKTISDAGLKGLARRCPNLTSVNLTWCYQVSDVGLKGLARRCPKLTTVNLRGCEYITDAGVKVLAKSCSGLTSVDLRHCREITNAGLQALVEGCPGLTSVDLSECYHIDDLGLQALAQGCKSLTFLSLEECEQITDLGLSALAQGCSNLTHVDLRDCPQITDAGLVALARGCPNLVSVDLDGCELITGVGLQALAKGCLNLTNLSLYDCKHITSKEKAALNAQYSHIEILISKHLS